MKALPRISRPRLTYANVAATLALLIATSMGGAYAHGKIGTSQIKKGAVTTSKLHGKAVAKGKIKPKAVTRGKLAPAARTNIRVYEFGAVNMTGCNQTTLAVPVSAAILNQSRVTVKGLQAPLWYQLPGPGPLGNSQYRLYNDINTGSLWLNCEGPGEAFTQLKVYVEQPTIDGGTVNRPHAKAGGGE